MKIVALKERELGESRVAITPETVKLFVKKGLEVWVESLAGVNSGYSDSLYSSAGAKISSIPLEIIGDADIVLKVKPSPQDAKFSENEFMKPGAILVSLLNPYNNKNLINLYQNKKISSFAMELVPRITRAQTMDVLSSQSNIAGYRAVIEACYHFYRLMPMMMTAAGTIHPASVLVIGAGVAGLQAIATAKRMGAIVWAFDVRSEAKSQVESLGAKFVEVVSNDQTYQTDGGYAKETSEEYKIRQKQQLFESVKKSDIVITTALIPGKPAPKLVTKDMVEAMKPGSVIVDLASASGGNCEYTEFNKTVDINSVKIIGDANLVSKVSGESSRLYAKNLYYFIDYLISVSASGELNIKDEIISSMLITYKGEIVHNNFKELK